MSGGSPVISRPTVEKSNTELVISLRTNFLAAQCSLPTESPSPTPLTTCSSSPGSHYSGANATSQRPPFRTWTHEQDDTLYVPAIDWSLGGLKEERSQYDITVKLFYLPNVPPSNYSAHAIEAIDLVLKELQAQTIDLLIVSFPSVAFDADDEDDGDECDVTSSEDSQDIETIVPAWRTLETLLVSGTIAQLGLAEFGSQRLARFLPHAKVRPSVDQINVRDCCVVPKQLILYARQEGIELLTHNDCTNILPTGTLRELLGSGKNGAGVLAESRESSMARCEGLTGEVEPQFVVKYTAVVKDRGVVENKGYFAVAELKN
jgi:glutamate--cysteine ligase regulatory subunit